MATPDPSATPPATPLRDTTRDALARRAARTQSERRLPSLVAGIARDGALAWDGAAGTVAGGLPGPDTQYRIGSITKTFTAVLVMRLRDEGRLDLDDPVHDHVAGTPLGELTVGTLLAHTSGIQAETAGPWWERTAGTDLDALLEPLDRSALLHPGARTFHYSNLGYALLGGIVERHRERPWFDVLHDEVLAPLGMTATTYEPREPHARGYAVHPWADVVLPEPAHDAGAMAPAGQLWSTPRDLAVWADVLCGAADDVLAPDTLEEMSEPVVVHDENWTVGHGLGLQVFRHGEHRWVGHGGSMPGFLAHLLVDRDDRTGAIVMANATSGLDDVAWDLLATVVADAPRPPRPWAPDPTVDADILDVLGPWYWGPAPFALRWERGELRLEPLGDRGRSSRFTPNEDGTWTGRDGYYRGETLRIVRHDGVATHLELATFVFTRRPYDPEAPVPGGVDTDGWRAQA